MTNVTATEVQQETGLYDMKSLDKMKLLGAHAPEAMKAFVAFDRAALAEGAIPVKYKELMDLAPIPCSSAARLAEPRRRHRLVRLPAD